MKWPNITAQHFVCSALILLGFFAYGSEAVVNVVFALRHTVDDVGRYTQAAQALAIVGAVFALSSLAGILFRKGGWLNYVMAGVFFLTVTLFLAYSLSNSVGFSFEQTVGRQRLVTAQNQRAKDIAERQEKQLADARKQAQAFAERTYIQAYGKQARQEARELMKEALTAPTPIVPLNLETLMPDGKAEAIGGWLGVKPDAFRLLDSTYMSLLMALIKWLFPTLGFGYWPRGSREGKVVANPEKPAEPIDPADLPQPVRTVDELPAMTQEQASEERQAQELSLVKEFLRVGTERTGDESLLSSTDLYDAFRAWSQRGKHQGQTMTGTSFGNRLRELGLTKVKHKKKRFCYVGIRLRKPNVVTKPSAVVHLHHHRAANAA